MDYLNIEILKCLDVKYWDIEMFRSWILRFDILRYWNLKIEMSDFDIWILHPYSKACPMKNIHFKLIHLYFWHLWKAISMQFLKLTLILVLVILAKIFKKKYEDGNNPNVHFRRDFKMQNFFFFPSCHI